MEQMQSRSFKDRVFTLPVILLMLLLLWIVGGLSVITIFILGRSWKGVVLTSLVLFGGIQVFFWYFRAKTLLAHRLQIRNGIIIHPRNSGSSNYPKHDDPPTYEDILKEDPPPPAYCEVISEALKFPFFTPSTPASPAPSIKSKPGTSQNTENRRAKKSEEVVYGLHKLNSKPQLEERRERRVVLPKPTDTNNLITQNNLQTRLEGHVKESETRGHLNNLPVDRESEATHMMDNCRCTCSIPGKHSSIPERVNNFDQTTNQGHDNPAFQSERLSGSKTDECCTRCCHNNIICQEERHKEFTIIKSKQREDSQSHTTPVSPRRQTEVAQWHIRNSTSASASRNQDPVSTIRLPIVKHISCPRAQL